MPGTDGGNILLFYIITVSWERQRGKWETLVSETVSAAPTLGLWCKYSMNVIPPCFQCWSIKKCYKRERPLTHWHFALKLLALILLITVIMALKCCLMICFHHRQMELIIWKSNFNMYSYTNYSLSCSKCNQYGNSLDPTPAPKMYGKWRQMTNLAVSKKKSVLFFGVIR